MKLVLATSNKGKVREIKALCEDYEVIPYSELIEDLLKSGCFVRLIVKCAVMKGLLQYRSTILVMAGIFAASTAWLIINKTSPQEPEEPDVHHHAGFVIFADGEKVDFSADKYMHTVECSLDEHEHTPEEEQIEKAHLHSGIGDVVHVHRPDVVWADLFINLNYSLGDASFSAYLNDELVSDIFTTPIAAYNSLVIITGEAQASPAAYLEQAITLDHIMAAESMVESCGK